MAKPKQTAVLHRADVARILLDWMGWETEDVTGFWSACKKLGLRGSSANVALGVELEELRADARRYRFLRDGNGYLPEEEGVRGGDELDAMCDFYVDNPGCDYRAHKVVKSRMKTI